MIIVTYVDNCLIFSDEKEKIDKLLVQLKKTFNLTDEGKDVKAYLGIKMDKAANGTITMTQPALIQRILDALDLTGENVWMHDTPANTTLFKNEDSQAHIQTWNYRSVILNVIISKNMYKTKVLGYTKLTQKNNLQISLRSHLRGYNSNT